VTLRRRHATIVRALPLRRAILRKAANLSPSNSKSVVQVFTFCSAMAHFDSEADISPRGQCWTKAIEMALRVISYAAVERIGGPHLPRMRQNHKVIALQNVKIDRPNSGEPVEDKRQAPPREKVGLVGNTEMKVRAHRGTGVPDLGAVSICGTRSRTLTDLRTKSAYLFGAICLERGTGAAGSCRGPTRRPCSTILKRSRALSFRRRMPSSCLTRPVLD
jgi:hypothetical protein